MIVTILLKLLLLSVNKQWQLLWHYKVDVVGNYKVPNCACVTQIRNGYSFVEC